MQSAECIVRLVRIVVLFLACAAVCAPAWSQLDGIPVGPFLITPWIESDIDADSNLFNAPDTGDADADVSASVGLALHVLLPFKESSAEFRYNGAQVAYENEAIESDVRSEGMLGLNLAFSSGNELIIQDRFLRDFVQVLDTDVPEQGPGFTPETKYFGAPYHYNRFDVAFRRKIEGRKGFQAQIGRRDFIYQEGTQGGQYDFRGFDNTFEYYQPLSSNRKLVIHYNMKRFDDFRDCKVETIDGCIVEGEGVGVPFRQEVADTIQAGISGLGSVRPFFFRVGYGRFQYKSDDPLETRSNFRGLSGFARWLVPLGGRSSVAFSLSRRPLPSSYPTYYIGDQFRVIAERGFTPVTKLGLIAGVRLNSYADEIVRLDCDGLRKDLTWDVGFRASWDVHRMFELRLAAEHEQRNSNCENTDYESDTVNLGIRVGWF